ncbi:ALA-interacting subunit [Balamuthia mandrillaris]
MNALSNVLNYFRCCCCAKPSASSINKSKRPSNSAFKQQRLRACQPILTPMPVITTFFLLGLIFIPIGIVMLVTSAQIVEVEVRYDNKCRSQNGTVCTVTLHVDEKMEEPVYLYYKLSNYYQNHRKYVRSRNDAQLRGEKVTSYSALENCDPIKSVNGSHNSQNFYLPCGLIAHSIFNDTFVLKAPNGDVVPLRKEGIAWQSDLDHKFFNPPADAPGVRIIPDFTDEDFVVWMRTAALPTFKKLHRIIDDDLPAGDYTVEIQDNYPVDEFDGEKHVVLTTISWMGGKNNFLGVAYTTVGSICVLLGVAFGLRHFIAPRKLGDISYLDWNR